MKVEWDTEELYPVYVLLPARGDWPEHQIIVSDEFKGRYDHVMQQFWSLQKEIQNLIEKPCYAGQDPKLPIDGREEKS